MDVRIWIVTLFLLAASSCPVWSENRFEQERGRFLAFCDWQPAEKELLSDLTDGQLDGRSLLEAALIVGGNEPPQVAQLQASFSESCRRCRTKYADMPAGSEVQLRNLFAYLLANHLDGKYTPDLCDVGATISSGEFNCLTATILFRALCHEFKIDVQAAWEPSHVRCWIPIETDRAGYLVETTADSAAAAVSGLFPRSKLTERPLTQEQLLGKVFYNRGVRLLESNQFSPALTSTWASCLLDPNDISAQNNLRACLNNWALWVSQHDDFNFAIRLLDAGIQLDPSYEPFSRNRRLLKSH